MTGVHEGCPFCGGNQLMADCQSRVQQMLCMTCGARGPEVARFEPYASAVDAWNKRAALGVATGAPADPRLQTPEQNAQQRETIGRAFGVNGTQAPSVDDLMELARVYAHAYFNHHTGSRDGMLDKSKEALRVALTRGVPASGEARPWAVYQHDPGCFSVARPRGDELEYGSAKDLTQSEATSLAATLNAGVSPTDGQVYGTSTPMDPKC